ncbi:hypothetical protein SAMN05192539_105713 [Paraburkholderia diazotrophica]|uniref:Uncharacterized protein n=1 Tax=Paraburkholderia diazotrophica TaxID=667676 RepID=A0A1H7EEC6_9BURK|nr:hypothetical protein SAMN05192539_105713 [Paraburkholderia diazotrophica]
MPDSRAFRSKSIAFPFIADCPSPVLNQPPQPPALSAAEVREEIPTTIRHRVGRRRLPRYVANQYALRERIAVNWH